MGGRILPERAVGQGIQHRVFQGARKRGAPRGRSCGIPLASDDRDAMDLVAGLVRDAGFDPVIAGALARGKEFEPGAPTYNTGMSGSEVRGLLGLSS